MGDYLIHIASLAGIYSIAALGLNYASGYAGLISLGHGAFLGLGAYGSAVLLTRYGVDFPFAVIGGGFAAGIAAWLLSFPLLRLKGDSFVLVSFGFVLVVGDILLNWHSLTNGALGMRGIPRPSLEGLSSEHTNLFFLSIVLLILALTLLIFRVILQSPYGVILRSVRENPVIAQVAGHDALSYQRSAFLVSAVTTGVAGALLASFISAIDPFLFNYHASVLLTIMVIFGGLASLRGAVIGASILILLPEALRFIGLPHTILAESQWIIYGMVMILFMVYRPRGLFGTFKI